MLLTFNDKKKLTMLNIKYHLLQFCYKILQSFVVFENLEGSINKTWNFVYV